VDRGGVISDQRLVIALLVSFDTSGDEYDPLILEGN